MKPGIIVLSKDNDENFNFMSDGWFQIGKRTKKAQETMTKARKCILDGSDVKDAIERLKKAGFKIIRN